jgi:hypothetical protein
MNMKRFAIAAFAVCIMSMSDSSSAISATTVSDEDNSKTEIEEVDSDLGIDIPFVSKRSKTINKRDTIDSNTIICSRNSRWELITKGIAVGGNSLQSTPAEMNGHRNIGGEFFWSDILGVRFTPWAKGPGFSLGFGILWDNYSINNELCFGRGEDRKSVVCEPYVEGAEDLSSKIHMFSLLVPFSVKYNITPDWKVEVGAWAVFATHACVSTSYTVDDIKYREKWTGMQKRTFRMSYIAQIGYQDVGIFVKYTPKNVIKTGYGPQFKEISAGVIVGF